MKNLDRYRKAGLFNRSLALLIFSIFAAGSLNAQGKILLDEPVSVDKERVLAAPTPIFMFGRPYCKDLVVSGDPAFAHMNTAWEFRTEFTPPEGASGPFFFVTNGNNVVAGGASEEPLNSVAFVRTGGSLNWTSTRFITAVIVSTLTSANVYPYNPASKGGIPNGVGLTSPTSLVDFNRVTFCFQEQLLIPSAAPVSLSGRVISTNGRGLAGVSMIATNAATGDTVVVRTSTFGYYRFDDLSIGDLYVISAESKRYQFHDAQRTIILDDNFDGYDFVAID